MWPMSEHFDSGLIMEAALRIVGTVTALMCIVSAASAADLPARRMTPTYVAAPPVFSWTGAYAGLNAGYAFDANTSYAISGTAIGNLNAIATGTRPGAFATRADGFTGGGQIGYNYEFGNNLGFGGLAGAGLVAGLEADAAYTDLRTGGDFIGPLGIRDTNFQSRTDFVGTVRGRLGLAFGNLLVFGSGGFAYGGVKDSINYYTNGIHNYAGASDTIRAGYAYGGGIEYAIPTASFLNPFHAASVTVKAEYLHFDLGTSTIVAGNLFGNADAYVARVHNDGNLVRAGLNYKIDFSRAPIPVVARY